MHIPWICTAKMLKNCRQFPSTPPKVSEFTRSYGRYAYTMEGVALFGWKPSPRVSPTPLVPRLKCWAWRWPHLPPIISSRKLTIKFPWSIKSAQAPLIKPISNFPIELPGRVDRFSVTEAFVAHLTQNDP